MVVHQCIQIETALKPHRRDSDLSGHRSVRDETDRV